MLNNSPDLTVEIKLIKFIIHSCMWQRPLLLPNIHGFSNYVYFPASLVVSLGPLTSSGLTIVRSDICITSS